MRRIPFDPPWIVLLLVALVLAASTVMNRTDSVLGVFAIVMVASVIGTLAANRWYERYHLPKRHPRR